MIHELTITTIYSREFPLIVKRLIKRIDAHESIKYFVNDAVISTSEPREVHIKLDKHHMLCGYFLTWAMMEAYYGFTVTYREEGVNELSTYFFSIGGGEVDEVRSTTLLGLIEKLESMAMKIAEDRRERDRVEI